MQFFWMAAAAFVLMFAFFLALGAFDPGDVLPWTLAAIGLAMLWFLHAWWDARHRDGRRAPGEVHARERRGF